MPSPDATPYVNLTIYDKDPQDVYDAAALALQSNLPTWVPREGNTEVLLLEALAGQVAEGIFTINRLPDGIMEGLLQLFGILRDSGSPPQANLTFTMSNTLGYTIPAGTEARLTLSGGLEPILFSTDIDLVIPPASSTGVVTATGDRFTADANNIPTPATLELMDSLIYVDSVALTSISVGGSEPEDDLDYFTRGATRFARLSDTLVLPRHFVAYALEQPGIERAVALDNWDGSGGAPGDDPGHITIGVYGLGATLSAPVKTALAAAMQALAVVNLTVHVIDPTITNVNVTATVRALKGYATADVQASVVAALNAYLDPQTWNWGNTVRRNELITLVSNVEGADYLESMTTPAADTALSGYATLVDAGTLTITVNAAA